VKRSHAGWIGRRAGRAAIGCGLALAVTPVGVAAASTPVGVSAPVGVAAARTPAGAKPAPVGSAQPLLITRAELGSGWTLSDPAPARVPAISCHALPAGLQAERRKAVSSVTFAQGSAGPFVQQTAYRWATAATATAIWRQVARPGLLACLAQSLTKGGSSGVSFAVTGRRQMTAPSPGVGVRAYRVTATATIGGQEFPAYLDELVLNTGGAVSEVSIASYEQAPPAATEARIARLVAARGSAVARHSRPSSGR
jgi:hypothetical protein